MWDSMTESFSYDADKYLFAMPDTYIPIDIFQNFLQGDFTLGLFETLRPKRFGVLLDDEVVNKAELPVRKYQAWGVLGWTRKVVKYWQENAENIHDYTKAINVAMRKFGFTTKPMAYYYDLASWADYRDFITGEL
jgi:hypothetical protein